MLSQATQPALFTLTYNGLLTTVRAAAAELIAAGVCPGMASSPHPRPRPCPALADGTRCRFTRTAGDRVSLILPNGVDFIVAFLACTVARGIAAPLNPDSSYRELSYYMADAGAKVTQNVLLRTRLGVGQCDTAQPFIPALCILLCDITRPLHFAKTLPVCVCVCVWFC